MTKAADKRYDAAHREVKWDKEQDRYVLVNDDEVDDDLPKAPGPAPAAFNESDGE